MMGLGEGGAGGGGGGGGGGSSGIGKGEERDTELVISEPRTFFVSTLSGDVRRGAFFGYPYDEYHNGPDVLGNTVDLVQLLRASWLNYTLDSPGHRTVVTFPDIVGSSPAMTNRLSYRTTLNPIPVTNPNPNRTGVFFSRKMKLYIKEFCANPNHSMSTTVCRSWA